VQKTLAEQIGHCNSMSTWRSYSGVRLGLWRCRGEVNMNNVSLLRLMFFLREKRDLFGGYDFGVYQH